MLLPGTVNYFQDVLLNWALKYQDTRDYRLNAYFDLCQNEILTYYVQLNAAYPGRNFLPATESQAMYDATITAAGKGVGGKALSLLFFVPLTGQRVNRKRFLY